jgi:hypothetical protein
MDLSTSERAFSRKLRGSLREMDELLSRICPRLAKSANESLFEHLDHPLVAYSNDNVFDEFMDVGDGTDEASYAPVTPRSVSQRVMARCWPTDTASWSTDYSNNKHRHTSLCMYAGTFWESFSFPDVTGQSDPRPSIVGPDDVDGSECEEI